MPKKTQIQQAIDKINGEIALLVATRDRLVEAQRSQPTRRRRPATATTTGAADSATRPKPPEFDTVKRA